jgi:hypothetical protein
MSEVFGSPCPGRDAVTSWARGESMGAVRSDWTRVHDGRISSGRKLGGTAGDPSAVVKMLVNFARGAASTDTGYASDDHRTTATRAGGHRFRNRNGKLCALTRS